jgi:Domain of unknown function (DUF3883)
VTGETQFDVAPSDETISTYWRDPDVRKRHQHFSQVRITPLINSAVTDQTLRERAITDLEGQRQPQGVSSSWVTQEQLARIDQIMREQPDPGATLAQAGGGQFAPPTEIQKVEQAAISAVTAYYQAGGRTVDNVSMAKVGWDLTCTSGRQTARVEVKGVRGTRPIVFLTANELRAAQEVDGWYLAVVTRALEDAVVTQYAAQKAIAAALPYAYRANLQLD